MYVRTFICMCVLTSTLKYIHMREASFTVLSISTDRHVLYTNYGGNKGNVRMYQLANYVQWNTRITNQKFHVKLFVISRN